jgi:hypothetical protein
MRQIFSNNNRNHDQREKKCMHFSFELSKVSGIIYSQKRILLLTEALKMTSDIKLFLVQKAFSI